MLFKDFNLNYSKHNIHLSENFQYPNTFFRIVKKFESSNNIFYNIEDIIFNSKLSYSENKSLILLRKYNNRQLWNLIKTNDNDYIIKNKNNCFCKVEKLNILCEDIPFHKASKFNIVKIYLEVEKNYSITYFNILDKEPIDILIKYIDLRDPNLNREGIHQIEKDYDNEELRYSIRSIINNIPWVRKIFVVMPNEKVRYFQEYNLINEKIIYVKDKDLLGYDSSNARAFEFRYWKLKEFGISDNIIVMDDDYFIGRNLEKSDFFYIKDGRVLPSIVTSYFLKIDTDSVNKYCKLFKEKAENSKEEQNGDVFSFSKYLTFSFILNLFNKSFHENVYIPKFTHNALPLNLFEIKEAYELIYRSKYKYPTLDSPYRHLEGIQFQIFMLSYTFMKYERKVNNIPNKFIQLNDSISANYKFSLFCINKGAGNFSYLNFYKAKIVMEYLFPIPSPYEIIDYSFINLSFNVTNSLNNEITKSKIMMSHMITKKECFYLFVTIISFFIIIIIKLFYIGKNYCYFYY